MDMIAERHAPEAGGRPVRDRRPGALPRQRRVVVRHRRRHLGVRRDDEVTAPAAGPVGFDGARDRRRSRKGTPMQAVQLVQWKHAPEVREVPDPDPAPGEVVIKVPGPAPATRTSTCSHDFEPGRHALRAAVHARARERRLGPRARRRRPRVRGRRAGGGLRPVGLRALHPLPTRAWRTTASARRRSAPPAVGSVATAAWPSTCSSRTPGSWCRSATSIRSTPHR